MATKARSLSLFDPALLRQAVLASVRKLDPRLVARNPVMFVVEVGSVLTTLLWLRDRLVHPPGAAPGWFTLSVSLWLWFTVLFANFAEAVAEGRGKAQAEALRRMRREIKARKLVAVILVVGALTYFPALSLSPVLEHFAALHGKVF